MNSRSTAYQTCCRDSPTNLPAGVEVQHGLLRETLHVKAELEIGSEDLQSVILDPACRVLPFPEGVWLSWCWSHQSNRGSSNCRTLGTRENLDIGRHSGIHS